MNRRCVICGLEPGDNADSKQNFYFPKSKSEALIWQRCMKAENVSLNAIQRYCCLCIEHIPQFVQKTQEQAANLNLDNIVGEVDDIKCRLENCCTDCCTGVLKKKKSVNVLVLTGASLPLFCSKSSKTVAADLNEDFSGSETNICVLESNFVDKGTAFPDIDMPEFRVMRTSAKNDYEPAEERASRVTPKHIADDKSDDSMHVLLMDKGEHAADACPCNCDQCVPPFINEDPCTNNEPPDPRVSTMSGTRKSQTSNNASIALDSTPNFNADSGSPATCKYRGKCKPTASSFNADQRNSMNEHSFEYEQHNESYTNATASCYREHSSTNYIADPNTCAAKSRRADKLDVSPVSLEQCCIPLCTGDSSTDELETQCYICRSEQCVLQLLDKILRSNEHPANSRTSMASTSRQHQSMDRGSFCAEQCTPPVSNIPSSTTAYSQPASRESYTSNQCPCISEQYAATQLSQVVECQKTRITDLEKIVSAQKILYDSLQYKVDEMRYQLYNGANCNKQPAPPAVLTLGSRQCSQAEPNFKKLTKEPRSSQKEQAEKRSVNRQLSKGLFKRMHFCLQQKCKLKRNNFKSTTDLLETADKTEKLV